jgi:ADP-heptose:LPS heptosyltransferase/predicted SAM-dependent methyltransferase
MVWRLEDSQGNEAGKIVWELVPYTRGRGLDLGCGPSKAFPHFIGVDNRVDTQLFGVQMNPDITVDDCAKLGIFGSASMDFVFSSHLLEHIQDFKAALKEWWRVIKPNGYLVLYLPHKNFYPNIGTPGSNPDHKHDFMPEDIEKAMKEIGHWDLVRNEDRNENIEYSFFQVYQKKQGKHEYSYKKPRPEKRCAIVRYGAFGDLIQASSLFPGLKAEGYHVTVYTTTRGAEIIKHDPNVDHIQLQDTDQVPNHLLPDFWNWESKKYDKWINLSESVEGTWLGLPGRTNANWPINLRRKYMNTNYLEFAHDLAGLPHEFHQKFYPSADEKAWAVKERKKIGGDKLFMYCLSGSGVHKVWPHMDAFLARLLITYPNARIMTVGGPQDEMLETGWENEKRVVRMAGKHTIRETLSMLDQVDMVIGPETGVINASGFMSMPKILFLSHSSNENLSKHWVNTIALEPKNTACFPCHLMHFGWDNCKRDDATGTAACAADIGVDQTWDAVQQLMKKAA